MALLHQQRVCQNRRLRMDAEPLVRCTQAVALQPAALATTANGRKALQDVPRHGAEE
jgi:hypothetical protein